MEHKQIVKRVVIIVIVVVGVMLTLHVLNTYVGPGVMDAIIKLHGG